MDILRPGERGNGVLKPRRYSAGFLLNGHYYLHGGCETNNTVLREMISIDLENMNWKIHPLQESTKVEDEYGITDFNSEHVYGHKMCLVTKEQRHLNLDDYMFSQ